MVILGFARFLLVGTFGFFVDAVVFSILFWFDVDLLLARYLAFIITINVTWLGNKYYTFKNTQVKSVVNAWSLYFVASHIAGGVNILVFSAIVEYLPMPIAFAAGVLVGLFFNFSISRGVIFVHKQQ